MLKPLYTEKSTKLAKEGKYTFLVSTKANKIGLKSQIGKLFGVTVTSVKTSKIGPETKRNYKGFTVTKNALKKAVVTLKDGEKIDLFEDKKK